MPRRRARPPRKKPDFELIRAADVKPEKVEFLWLDRIPKGTLTLIGGRPGEGKSLFTNFLAAHVTKSGGAVVMSNPEDGLTSVKVPRLLAAKADTRLIHFWPNKVRLPDDVELLEQLVVFHGVELVTIDPIAKHIRGKDPASALEPVVAMAERTGCAVVGVHHIVKRLPKDCHPRDAFGGAYGGWLGTARCAHILGPAEAGDEGTRYMATVKANFGPDERPSVEFYIEEVEIDLPEGDVTETGRMVLVSESAGVTGSEIVQWKGGGYKHQPADGPKMELAKELLSMLLLKEPLPAQEVWNRGAEAGVSKMTLKRASQEMGIVKKRVGSGAGSFVLWSLPVDKELDKFLADLLDDEPDEGK